ncbi:RagB/SusD family nutrient uptake outer membrane protein [Natronogracilivirga saccharolytica]|uniref:RagB/SusD family nutrient uptake outer membrane protein n=1 Tax=Natronogracilivirga saccharolytica TaxID=2812953 RepID=A0A8J7RP13_9BACT|nr:RagB/SusD family nutrient uptake outer membrane protein [Natronogracilivirga saccharolytica]MBP3191204.1 RagB/SusD family nutrient uptake outer membrane protein [Natronogracilivirga saccharolytica]
MLTRNYRILLIAMIVAVVPVWTSCTDDLSTSPIDDSEVTSDMIYEDPENFRKVLAKLYAGLAVTGQEGPAGSPDIDGIDEGFSSYIRQLWVTQELPTDQAVVAWPDPGLPGFNTQSWSPGNDFVMGMYSRIFYQITLANEFIRNARDEDDPQIQQYMAEARFLRAFSYWHALDLFGGNIPFVTEDDPIGAFEPEPVGSEEIFSYIESELMDIEDAMPAPQENQYGRADRAGVWMLLARLYLNAEVYIDEPRYDEAVTYTQRIIDEGGYELNSTYDQLFLADNDEADGVIFAIPFDGNNTQSFGGTNFIIHAAVGGSMSAADFGISGGWEGHRVTPEFVDKFDKDNDVRAMFHTDGQNRDVDNLGDFNEGYAVTKWRNVTSTGEPGSRSAYVDTDFPMFRLADVYLMYAEATLRGGAGGDMNMALNLVNDIRERAYGDETGHITSDELDLDFILDERARELYWEAQRRTDLIRYGYYTSADYVWAWKGDTQEGTSTSEHLKLYPIPSSDINSNPNLTQNPGY